MRSLQKANSLSDSCCMYGSGVGRKVVWNVNPRPRNYHLLFCFSRKGRQILNDYQIVPASRGVGDGRFRTCELYVHRLLHAKIKKKVPPHPLPLLIEIPTPLERTPGYATEVQGFLPLHCWSLTCVRSRQSWQSLQFFCCGMFVCSTAYGLSGPKNDEVMCCFGAAIVCKSMVVSRSVIEWLRHRVP